MTKKLYIDNPYLKEAKATILENIFNDQKYFIKLDKTIFFPHLSGGQPRDLGTIEGREILDTYEDGSDIVHVVKEDINAKDVVLSIDWENRFDLMQQHSGQHILSSTFEKLFNAKTMGFHLGREYITIDVELSSLDQKDILQAETLSNKIIQSNFKITNSFLDQDKKVECDLSKISDNDQRIRIVNIENISASPCCGTHVSSTGEIGLIKIINAQKYKGNTRVSFICGNRALDDYSSKNTAIRIIAQSLSSGIPDVLDKFIGLKDHSQVLEKENRSLREEIISLKGENLFKKVKAIKDINYIIEDVGEIDKKELNIIASYISKKDKTIQIYKLKNENQGMFLISKSHDLDLDLKELFDKISQKIIVKGGGNKEKIQGVTSLSIIDRVLEMFYKDIKDYFKTNRD